MPKTDLPFNDHFKGYIADQIQAGKFENEMDVIEDALALHEKRAEVYHQKRAEWDAMIDEGLADARAGRMVDGETFLRERIERLKARL